MTFINSGQVLGNTNQTFEILYGEMNQRFQQLVFIAKFHRIDHDDHKLKNITSESIEGNSEPSHRRFLIFNPLTKQLTNQLTNPLTNQTRQSVIQLNMNSPLPKRARNFQENIPPIQKESSIFNKPIFSGLNNLSNLTVAKFK